MLSIFKYIPALFKKIVPNKRYTGWVFRTRDKEGYFALEQDKFIFGIENDEGSLQVNGNGSLFLSNDGTYKNVVGAGGFDYRAGSATLNAGAHTVNFTSPLSDASYTVLVKVYDSNGNEAVHILGSKTAAGFNITLFFNGTIYYTAFPNR